jgi:hypothetical protein
VPGYGECYVSFALGIAPFILLCVIAALFGANTVQSGGQNVHGIGAVFLGIVMCLIFPAIFAGLQKLGYLIWGFIRPKQDNVTA